MSEAIMLGHGHCSLKGVTRGQPLLQPVQYMGGRQMMHCLRPKMLLCSNSSHLINSWESLHLLPQLRVQ